MCKKFSIFCLVLLFSFNFWANPVFFEDGYLVISDSTPKSHYSFGIECKNNSWIFMNGVLFAQKGEEVTISYSGAYTRGFGSSEYTTYGYSTKDTKLTIYDLNKNEYLDTPDKGSTTQYNYSITISETSDYDVVFKIYENEKITKITTIRIVYVNEESNIREISFLSENDKQKCIVGFNGKLNAYVKSNNAFMKPNGSVYPVWYVKKGTELEYAFIENRIGETTTYPVSPGSQLYSSDYSKVIINGKDIIFLNRIPANADEDMDIEVRNVHDGPDGYRSVLASKVFILVDDNGPEMTLSNGVEFKTWTNKGFTVSAKDEVTGINRFSVKKDGSLTSENFPSATIDMSERDSGIYEVTAYDNVGNTTIKNVYIDKDGPEINFYTNPEHTDVFTFSTADNKWTRQNIYLDFKDHHSDFSEYTDSLSKANDKIVCGTGIHVIKAKDYLGNVSEETVYIDQTAPEFKTEESYYVDDAGNRFFQLSLTNIFDEHSGIAGITVTPIVNNKSEDPVSIDIKDKKGQHRIENITYTYDKNEALNRNIDNKIKFIVTVTDEAGNPQTVTLGGEQGYFVPAAIFTKYVEPENKKNCVKVNFYNGKYKCNKEKYRSIRLKRHFSLINSKNPSLADEITEANFGQTNSYWFNTSAKGIWETLTNETGRLDITTDNSETYFIDTAIKNSGFTHKNISYDCIYEYTNPVNAAETVTEKICNDEIIKLSNNKGRYSIRVKGEDNTYLVIDDEGRIEKGSTETFKMPDTGIVELAVKVEDPDIEPYHVEIQGYAELTSEKGKFKLQETDTNPVETKGGTAGCGEFVLGSNNKNVFISADKQMEGNWVKIGEYALQYNVTTVLAVELTEGFPGSQEPWTYKTVRLYAKSPSVLGGKAQLLVGDAGSYNADGITARPWQPFKMEIVPADENQTVTELFWDFGNGLTSDACGDYDKKSNSKFENIYYKQSEKRTGALSEYKLRIRTGSDEAEFKVNIIDTQWGTLYGDEVWRGQHIIKKEIKVPAGVTLQIGDTAPEHRDYDSNITCLCVGKINPEEKSGITVEEGGTLKIDEGSAKRIKFIQGDLGTDSYEPATVKSFENRWKGIKVKGKLEGDRLEAADAEKALVILGEGSVVLTGAIELNDCLEGILMDGAGLKAEEIDITGSKSSVFGIKTDKKIDCQTIKISGAGRGIILLSGGELDIKALEIGGCKTGIHLLGGNLKIESGRISGCSEYGIKTDKDGNYNYEQVIVENNERNIYEDGIIK